MEAIEYLKLATDKTEAGDLIKENNLTEAVVKLMDNYAEFRVKNCSIHDVISRLQKLKRFDLANYRDGEYGIDTEREENDNGDYIDAYEIDVLIKDLTNGL